MSRKRRVLVLVHPSRIPPEGSPTPNEVEKADWVCEFQVINALYDLQHKVKVLGIDDDLRPLRASIGEWKPHVVFNLLEEFRGEGAFDQHVVSYLELLGVKFTGCNPFGLTLARDKALTKKILSYHGIDVPRFAVFPKGEKVQRPADLPFPLFVKSLSEEASLGISQASLVHNDEALEKRVQFMHETIGTHAIAEQYIDGREIYVGVMGNEKLTVLPPWELFFENLPDNAVPIATRKAKWDEEYQLRNQILTGPSSLPDKWLPRLRRHCREIYRALGLSGYARMDLRVTNEGRFFLIEANPNPGIARIDEFSLSAEGANIPYATMINRIINNGLRYDPVSRFRGDR